VSVKRLLLTGILALMASSAHAEHLTFTTESYPPYSFISSTGKPSGVGVDLVDAIMRASSVKASYTIEVMPWARALALAETSKDHCVFAAARTKEREKSFQWVTPFFSDINLLVALKSSPVEARTIEQAKKYTVSTQRGDYTQGLLKEQGFEKIDVSANFETSLAKLMAGRIDLIPMSESVYNKLIRDGAQLRRLMIFSEQKLGIACNREISPDLIARMQAALDTLRSTGEQDRILRKYGLMPPR